MYQSVRRPTRDEICPTALQPQRSILSMPVVTEEQAMLLGSRAVGCHGVGAFCAHPSRSLQRIYSKAASWAEKHLRSFLWPLKTGSRFTFMSSWGSSRSCLTRRHEDNGETLVPQSQACKGVERPGQWDPQNSSSRWAPPRLTLAQPAHWLWWSGTESWKLGQTSQDFHSVTACSWHFTGLDGALPRQYCVHTVCNHRASLPGCASTKQAPHTQDMAEIQSPFQSWKLTTFSPQLNLRVWHDRNIAGMQAFNFPCASTGCAKCSHRKAETTLVVEPWEAEQTRSCQILRQPPCHRRVTTCVGTAHNGPSTPDTLCKYNGEESNLFYFNSCT